MGGIRDVGPAAVLIATALAACTSHEPAGRTDGKTVPGVVPSKPAELVKKPPKPKPEPPAPEQQPEPEPKPDTCFDRPWRLGFKEWALNGAAADVNKDGDLDVIAVFSGDNTFAVFLADGQGGFTRGDTIATAEQPMGAMPADFDRDGFVDVAIADAEDKTVTVYRGDGKGHFDRGTTSPAAKYVGRGPAQDIDGDDNPDLIVTMWSSLRVLKGDGKGGFRRGPTLRTGQAPSDPALADLNGDGAPDLLSASNDDHFLAVFMGKKTSRGRVSFNRERRHPCGKGGTSVRTGDFNGDDVPDVVMANIHSDDVCVWMGQGGGALAEPISMIGGGYTNAIAIRDFTGDGIDDIAAAAWDMNTKSGARDMQGIVTIFAGSRQHEPGAPLPAWARLETDRSPTDIWATDTNHDEYADVVVLNSNGRSLEVFRGRPCGSRE